MNTFEDFKNQVAVKSGYDTFNDMIQHHVIDSKSKQDFYYGIEKLFEEATTLFVESERKRAIEKVIEILNYSMFRSDKKMTTLNLIEEIKAEFKS